MYKLSLYNKIWKISDGSFMVFNTISGGVFILKDEIYKSLQANQWEKISEETIVTLLKAYVLIPKQNENKDIFNFELLGARAQKDRLGIFIVPSRLCNLECTYCIQNNLFENKSDSFLTKTIIDKYYEWIEERIQKWGTRKLDIIFYGGEPLTADTSVLQYLIEKFDLLPTKPSYRLISNGTKLSSYANFLKHMDTVQITMDGNRQIHDQRRVTKNNTGTYDIILKNIFQYLEVSENNKVIIRMNVDKENRESLLDSIKKIINCLPIHQIEFQLCPVDPYLEGMTDKMVHGDIKKTANAITDAYAFLKKDYNKSPYIWRVNCGVSSICQWSFDTEGSIYKCPAQTGKPEEAVYNVNEGYFRSSFYNTMNHVTDEEDCLACTYLGICYGGCIRQRELTGNKSCKKDFFDEYIPRIIEIKYGV